MRILRDAVNVQRSVAETRTALERFFASLKRADGVARLRLRVPTDGAQNGYGISLDREVRIEARSIPHTGNAEQIEISWMPEGMLVFPRFDGTLTVSADTAAHGSRIELDGCYTPPFGAAGQLFDAAIGHRIAQRTAREFLNDLKDAVENG